MGQRERTLYFELLFWGVSIISFFLFLSDGPIRFAHYHPKKGWGKLGGTSSNEKEFSPKMDVTYSCFVHHMLAKKEEGLLI
jgi:hypothetical protein